MYLCIVDRTTHSNLISQCPSHDPCENSLGNLSQKRFRETLKFLDQKLCMIDNDSQFNLIFFKTKIVLLCKYCFNKKISALINSGFYSVLSVQFSIISDINMLFKGLFIMVENV